jgi:RHS repeat-associated protein
MNSCKIIISIILTIQLFVQPIAVLASKTSANVTTNYTYAGNQVVNETQNNVISASYTIGGGEITKSEFVANGESNFHFTDALGSVTSLTNNAGSLTSRSDYDAFGLQTGNASSNSIGYTGQRLDNETGLMALGNGERYYSPTYARFIQQDSFSGNGSMPQSLNRFAYSHNNPNKFTDPSGHKVVDPFAKPVAKKAKNAKSEENNTDRSSYKFWDDASKSDSYLESGAGYTGKFFYGFGDLLTSGGVSRQDRILTAYQRGEISGTEALWRTGGNIAVSAPLLVAGILTGGSSIYVQVGITMIAAGVQRFGTDSYEIAYEGRERYSSAGEYATDIALAGAFTVGGHLLTKYGGKALKYAENKLMKLEEAAGSDLSSAIGKSSIDFVEKGKRFLGGKRATALEIQAAIDELAPHGIDVLKKADSIIKKANPEGVAAFQFAGKKRLLLPDEVTRYGLFHEMEHARHFIEVGEEAYKAAGKFAREKRVFDKIMGSKAEFSIQELEHAELYINRLSREKALRNID